MHLFALSFFTDHIGCHTINKSLYFAAVLNLALEYTSSQTLASITHPL